MNRLATTLSLVAFLALPEGASSARTSVLRSTPQPCASFSTQSLALNDAATPAHRLGDAAAPSGAYGPPPSATETGSGYIRMCHISHHPLGRMHSNERKCPLYFAHGEASSSGGAVDTLLVSRLSRRIVSAHRSSALASGDAPRSSTTLGRQRDD
jgi:hypothetical protein